MSVRKINAVLVIGVLVLFSVATGSLAAYAAPNPPTVDQTFADPWVTSSTQPAVQGTMDLGITQINVESSNDGVTYTPYCTVTTNPSATVWFCSAPTGTLTRGTNLIRATATDAVPETSAPSTTPIGISVVDGPRVDSPADDLYTNDYQPTFTGTSDGTYFDVYTSDFATHFCGGTVVNLSWNCTAATIPDGDYTYLVQSTYGATTLYSPYRTLHIDTVAPAAPSINPLSNPVNSSPEPLIDGSAEEGATIELFVDGAPANCTNGAIDYTGYWSCSLLDTLPAGPHSLTATQTDQAGNVSAISSPAVSIVITDTSPPAPPVVTAPIGTVLGGTNLVTTNETTPMVAGTGEPGATLNVVGNTCMIVPTIVDASGNWSCQLTTPMTPDGDYDVHFGQTDTALNSSVLTSPYLSFTVDTVAPDAPEVWTPAGPVGSGGYIEATTSDTTPVITGNGEGSAPVFIYRDGSYLVNCDEGPPVAGEGGFSCTLSDALSVGIHTFQFAQTDSAGNSSGAPVTLLQLTVLAPPAPPTPPAPPAPPAPPTPPVAVAPLLISWLLNFHVSSSEVLPGQTVTFTASNLPPGANVSAELHSDPISLGTTTVRPNGTFILSSIIPDDAPAGDHHYVITVTPTDGTPASTVQQPVTVVAAPVTATPTTPDADEQLLTESFPGDISGGATTSRDDPASPNTLSNSLPTLLQVISNPVVIGAAAASSLALLFLVALPAELLNSTIDEHYQRIFGRIPKVRMIWLKRLRERLAKAPIVGGLALTALAALIFGFSDPNFGFDIASLRMLLASLASMFILGYLANWLLRGALKKLWKIPSAIELQPFGLVLAIVGVVLSRVMDFTPGLLVGLVLTLTLGASTTERDEIRSVLLWAGGILGISVISWVGYSVMSLAPTQSDFGSALLNDTLVATATAGVSALVIGLLPIGYFDGRTLYRHSRLRWLCSYLVVLIAFFVIVVPSGVLWGGIQGPFWIWLTILLVFAALCVGTFLYFRLHPTPGSDAIAVAAEGEKELNRSGH